MKKNSWINLIIVLAVIALAFILLTGGNAPETDEETAKCIGQKSAVYERLGCSHCEDQKAMFGDNYQYITSIDCFYEREVCAENGIEGTPTWIIGGEKHEGVQSIDKLKQLTGC